MPIVLIEKDPFAEDLVNQNSTKNLVTSNNVRRPTFGHLERKETFASLSVKAMDTDGSLKDLVITNSSAPDGKGVMNHNFIIQGFAVSSQEKFQVVETFGDEYLFFFGERPVIIQVQGFLLNTPDFNWRGEWYDNYSNFLRGTKCVEKKARVYLVADGLIFSGYILSTTTQVTDAQPRLTPFSFQMIVTNFVDTNSQVVKKSEESRKIGDSFVEYDVDPVVEEGFVLNEDTRELVASTSGSSEQPSMESKTSAYWISDSFTGGQSYYAPNDAVREIAISHYENDNQVTRFEAVAAFNSGTTILSSSISEDVIKALGSGVRGAIVKD